METKVSQILYRSYKSDYFNESEVENILTVSRKNNALLDITGILVYRDGVFIQLLEGDKKSISELYTSKITKDRRHKDCRILLDLDDQTRIFPHWSMGVLGKSLLSSKFPDAFKDLEEKIVNDHLSLLEFFRALNREDLSLEGYEKDLS
jgi:hypothetical protein